MSLMISDGLVVLWESVADLLSVFIIWRVLKRR